jgi:hypothetical protein
MVAQTMPQVKVEVRPQGHLKVNAKHGPRDPEGAPNNSSLAKVDAALKLISKSCRLIDCLLGLAIGPSKFAL